MTADCFTVGTEVVYENALPPKPAEAMRVMIGGLFKQGWQNIANSVAGVWKKTEPTPLEPF